MHARGEDGSLAPIPFELKQDPEFHMAGGGLYGTAGDYKLHRQPVLLCQILQRGLRPCADVLDHFGRRERA